MLHTSILLYILLWLSFAFVHSFLANPKIKGVLQAKLSYRYRFFYNVISFVQLFYIYYFGSKLFEGFQKFDLPMGIELMMSMAVLVGVAITILAIWQYNPSKFIGLTEWQEGRNGQQSTLNSKLSTQGLNKLIRHPLYTGMFLMLWGMANSALGLTTAICGSAYLLIGQHFEEKKLVSYYGEQYQAYTLSVPAFLPKPFGRLKKQS